MCLLYSYVYHMYSYYCQPKLGCYNVSDNVLLCNHGMQYLPFILLKIAQ